MEILDSEKRRARNLIWNAAGDYDFEPELKAYDQDGRADLYWNSIIGTARRLYGSDNLQRLFAALEGHPDQQLFEQLIWLGLENAAFARESACRPALPALRVSYARRVLALEHARPMDQLLDVLESAHFRRALGQSPAMTPGNREMLDALEFPGDLDGPALARRALDFLHQYFHFTPGASPAERKPPRRRFLAFRRSGKGDLPAVRGFGYGYGEHTVPSDGGGTEAGPPKRRITDLSVAQSEAALQAYIQNFFGPSLYDPHTVRELESELCAGDHRDCRLYYARGDDMRDGDVRGYAGAQRRAASKQMEKNKAAYQADLVRHRAGIQRLTARIQNALLAYLQPAPVRAASGTLDPGRIWRGIYLDDDRVFTRVLRTDPGDLSVDLLLDASTSQLDRQATVAAQGYMIAESLTRCGIPVRVSSFCSLSGYTILSRYRDYRETGANERIFHYFTTGCNRDGLAIRAVGKGMEDSPCEHRLLILLTDARPNDVVKLRRGGSYLDYAGQEGIQNAAREVRSLLHRQISVVCVFTGDDKDVPAAHTIYGRDFARIRSLDQFADTVGTLIQNQIRGLS